MFNSYAYVKMVTNQTTNNHFQQVSGSLIKTHPDSIFVRFRQDSLTENNLFSNTPKLTVRTGWYESTYRGREPLMQQREATVLQILLAPDNNYICEVAVHYEKGDEQYTEDNQVNE